MQHCNVLHEDSFDNEKSGGAIQNRLHHAVVFPLPPVAARFQNKNAWRWIMEATTRGQRKCKNVHHNLEIECLACAVLLVIRLGEPKESFLA